MTYENVISPLALTAGTGLYGNVSVPAAMGINAAFVTQSTTYQAGLVANLIFSTNLAATSPALAISAGTLTKLKTIGANVCAALGDTVPGNIANVTISNSLVAAQMIAVGTSYISAIPKFIQAFSAADGYISVTNQVINSTVNANEYLGPTYTNMDDVITGNLTRVNLALEAWGQDLANLGNAINLSKIDSFGSPGLLISQISAVGNMVDGTTPQLTDELQAEGLTNKDIADLVNWNVQSLFNQDGLTPGQFDALQKKAYPALIRIVPGNGLEDILAILDVNLPVASLAEMLDPVKIFPNSFGSLTLPTPSGSVLIYNTDGTLNSAVEPILNSGTLTPVGCDQLAKIIPPAQAVANRAMQIALAQVSGLAGTSLPALAAALV